MLKFTHIATKISDRYGVGEVKVGLCKWCRNISGHMTCKYWPDMTKCPNGIVSWFAHRWNGFIESKIWVQSDAEGCDVIGDGHWWTEYTHSIAPSDRSQQQELATALVLVGADSQDARAIHGSSRSAMVHPSAFVLNGLRLVIVATPGWRNRPLLSTQSDNDDNDSDCCF